MQNIANITNLVLDKDIVQISNKFINKKLEGKIKSIDGNGTNNQNQSVTNIYNYLESNPGKVQYLILFCLTE